jgi:uncharacterized protein (DUF736 family)
MARIGTFKRTKTGISGRILTLALDAELILVPVDKSDAENAPDYRIHLGDVDGSEVGPEVGAGWKRTGEKAGEYVSLQLGACPNSRCSNRRDSDSTFGYEQVFSSLEYRSNAAAAAERAGLRAERPCLAIYG